MVLRLAVVGCGSWGINHVRAATRLTGAELVVTCDPNPRARERAAKVAPDARLVAQAEEVYADPAVDAVIIASPAKTHASLTQAALEAGKHVLVEKPFVLEPGEGEKLVALAESSGRTLMVGHLLRYHPYFRSLVERVRAGELGRLHYLYSERVNLPPMREGENVLWSLAPHDVSMMCVLMESEPVEVSSTGQAFLRPGIEDVVFATIRFANDAVGHLHASWLDHQKRRRLTVVGSKKMAVFDDMEPSEKLRIYDKGEQPSTFDPFERAAVGDIHIPAIPMIEPLAAEQQHFVDCARSNQRPETDGREALRVGRCLVAATESLRSGGKPVRL